MIVSIMNYQNVIVDRYVNLSTLFSHVSLCDNMYIYIYIHYIYSIDIMTTSI